MINVLLFVRLFCLSHFSFACFDKQLPIHHQKDSVTLIKNLYKDFEIISFNGGGVFNYKFQRNGKFIKVSAEQRISQMQLLYIVNLRDKKGIFDQKQFSIGDDYQYLGSYFMLNNRKVKLNDLHSINNKDETLSHISNLWDDFGFRYVTKYYKLRDREIYLIKGIDAYCNGNNCSDYIVYVVQLKQKQLSIHSIYFGGRNYPYDFNNTNLFYVKSGSDPQILSPKTNKIVKSNSDFDIYNIGFYKIYKNSAIER